jgi:hypothetical protein
MEGSDPICFWKGQCSDFTNPNPSFRWLPFLCDAAKAKVSKGWEAGLIQVKLSI